MTAVVTTTAAIETLADLLEQLGGIAPNRVRFRPAPGTATEEDVLAIRNSEQWDCASRFWPLRWHPSCEAL